MSAPATAKPSLAWLPRLALALFDLGVWAYIVGSNVVGARAALLHGDPAGGLALIGVSWLVAMGWGYLKGARQ